MEEFCQCNDFIIRDKPRTVFNTEYGQIVKFISGKLELSRQSLLRKMAFYAQFLDLWANQVF